LTGILGGEFYFSILVPIGIDLEFPFPDPFGVVSDDAFRFKMVFNLEFFQSDPD